MGGPSARAVLDLWETAEGLPPVERALALAEAAGPSAAADELSRLPLGQRDARLLRLRPEGALEATAGCPACGEPAEFSVDVDALLRDAEPRPVRPLELDGWVVSWRPPDSLDVAAASSAGDRSAAERVLLARCVESASGPGGEQELPSHLREALGREMAAADPLAEVLVDLACPVCATSFVADLDLGAFVWAELSARARRLMREVDVLARAYGWSEAEALELPEARRAAYLELASEGGR